MIFIDLGHFSLEIVPGWFGNVGSSTRVIRAVVGWGSRKLSYNFQSTLLTQPNRVLDHEGLPQFALKCHLLKITPVPLCLFQSSFITPLGSLVSLHCKEGLLQSTA